MTSVLERCGVYIQEQALAAGQCARVVHAMADAPGAPAEVFARAGEADVRPHERHARDHTLEPALEQLVADTFEVLRPRLAAHFQQPLAWCESPSFLSYGPGAFYRAHRDQGRHPESAEARGRVVSAVLCLNDGEGAAQPAFGGGRLVFYELLDGPAWQGIGLPLDPRVGQVAAFRSDVLHEVTPVTHGLRCVAVAWYHATPRP